MSGLSKLGTALSVVFVVSIVALVAEVLYVLWRRRLFRHQTSSADGSGEGVDISGETSSKELLYFLCWKNQSRVDHDGGGACPARAADGEEVIDVLKLQEMLGPSRVLFTIREEEREDLDSERSVCLSVTSSAEKVPKKTTTTRVTLEDCFSVAGDSPETTVTMVDDRETTPFSTPCDSPLYYTPLASPAREVG